MRNTTKKIAQIIINSDANKQNKNTPKRRQWLEVRQFAVNVRERLSAQGVNRGQ